jgi:hypothetical protein
MGDFALADLDTGLFFTKGGWTSDPKLAEIFADPETVGNMASLNRVKNAAAAMIDGNSVRGFLWFRDSN